MFQISSRVSTISRYLFAPINTGLAVDGAPTTELISFHCARAGNGIGVAYVGNVAVHPQYVTNAGTLCVTASSPRWTELVEAIAARGTVPAVQLAARISSKPATRPWVHKDPVRARSELAADLSSIPTAQLDAVAVTFGDAAHAMASYGFRIIQIHAAHGYLLSQLMTPALNIRTDEYGRDSLLLLRRCIAETRDRAPEVDIDVRLSLHVGAHLAAGYDVMCHLDELSKSVDMISFSAGNYELSRDMIYPLRRHGENVYVHEVCDIAMRYPTMYWSCAGNVRNISALQLPSNVSIGLGRPLLADPEFVAKSMDGRLADIAHCDWNGACHYYTRGETNIECPLSPDLAK